MFLYYIRCKQNNIIFVFIALYGIYVHICKKYKLHVYLNLIGICKLNLIIWFLLEYDLKAALCNLTNVNNIKHKKTWFNQIHLSEHSALHASQAPSVEHVGDLLHLLIAKGARQPFVDVVPHTRHFHQLAHGAQVTLGKFLSGSGCENDIYK